MSGKTGQFDETLKPGQRASFQVKGLKEDEMALLRSAVEGFLRKRQQRSPTKYTYDPLIEANRVLNCCVNGVKNKDGKNQDWFNAPGKLSDKPVTVMLKRLNILIGRGFKQYINNTPTASIITKKEPLKNKRGPKPKAKIINSIITSEEDFGKMQAKRAEYIEEFRFDVRADLVLLDRLVKAETIVEMYEHALLTGDDSMVSVRAAENIQKLTSTIINIQKVLGITAEQRSKIKAQSKEGTVAELYRKYEDTKREFPGLEQRWAYQELEMYLRKHNRKKEDGEREISAAMFARLNGGITVNEAYKILKRKNPDIFGSEEN